MTRALAGTALLAAAAAALALALTALGVPSPVLFATLLAGLAYSLVAGPRLAPLHLPASWFKAAQALTGVALGTFLQPDALQAVGQQWLPILLVGLGTLAISLVAGVVLARTTPTDPATAALGMIAGGASGIVGVSQELGGDDRLVAFMQYLRVLVVVLLTPVLVALCFPGVQAGAAPSEGPLLGTPAGWAVTLATAAAGVAIARAIRMAAGTLLWPMLLAGAITLGVGEFTVPTLVREAAFAAIGAQVGLRFTVATVREVGRLVLPVLAGILGVMAACFAMALALAAATDATLLDAYLATTPGGLYAVIAVAFGADADTTFIIAAQGLRVIVMVALAPLAIRWTVRRTGCQGSEGAPSGSPASAACRSSSENSGSSRLPPR